MKPVIHTTLALCMMALFACEGTNESKQEPDNSSAPTQQAPSSATLLELQERLVDLEASLLTANLDATRDFSDELALYDEEGTLWKAPTEGYAGFTSGDVFQIQLPLAFQDAKDPKIYHIQGQYVQGETKYTLNGKLTLLEAPRNNDSEAKPIEGTILGHYSFTQKGATRNQGYRYEGVVTSNYGLDPAAKSAYRLPAAKLPKGQPAVLFQGLRVSNDSTTAEWTVWGLGEEELLRAALVEPQPAL